MERLGIRVMKRTVGYLAFRRVLSINLLPRAILDLFICSVCIPVVLIQSNFDTPGDATRSDTNWLSRDVQPIVRDIFFSCSRAITIHQVIAIFLQFHCLSSYRNNSFPLQLIDRRLHSCSHAKCVTLRLSFVSVLYRSHIAIPTTKPIVNALAQPLQASWWF